MTDISIILVSWNVKEYLQKCLDSIYKNQGGLILEVIVVDNASKDSSVEMVKKKFPQAKIIANQDNRGFGAANNQGTKMAKGEYILFLNTDTEILEDCLQKSLAYLKANPRIGILGCQHLNPDGSLQASVRRFPTKLAVISILLKIPKLVPNLPWIKKYLAVDFDYSKPQSVDQVAGSFMLAKKSVLDQVGYFDEDFFLWFEEVDLCKRFKDGGFGIWYYPEAEIIHYGGRSFGQEVMVKNQRNFFKSALKYFLKHPD